MLPSLLPTLLAAAPAIAAVAQFTERVSLDRHGSQATGASQDPSISADGRYVAFASDAADLVRGDNNMQWDVFVHDRATGQIARVSVDSFGVEGAGTSYSPEISGDGRVVAFGSLAWNLVPGDTNGCSDVFVHEIASGITTRVSLGPGGRQASENSGVPAVSRNGRYVAFYSKASELVSGDTNATYDVFVHDRSTGTTSRVSVDSGGLQADWDSAFPSISADGQRVAFSSRATNLVAGDTNGHQDIFVHDQRIGVTVRASVSSFGAQANAFSYFPAMSADGRFVAFESSATSLVLPDTNGRPDIFVHDLQSGQTTRGNLGNGGTEAAGFSQRAGLSADGRYVVFESKAANLVPGDTNGEWDIFVHDRMSLSTTRASVSSQGTQVQQGGHYPVIASQGRYVAFDSLAYDLVPGDTNSASDVFVHDLRPVAPVFTAQGACPGTVALSIRRVTPKGGVVLAYGAAGTTTLGGGTCAGVTLDIAAPTLGAVIRASWTGSVLRSTPASLALCGLTVQALDVRTCKTSNPIVL